MQYKAGKTYAVTAHEAVTVYYQDVLLAQLAAGEQGFFVCPASTSSLTTSAHCSITECADTALALSVNHAQDKSLHISPAERTAWTNASTLVNNEALVTSASFSAHTSNSSHLTTTERSHWDAAYNFSTLASSSITQLNSSLDAVEESVTSLESSQSNLATSVAQIKIFPDWDNAVPLSLSDFPYTAPSDGWLVGKAYSSGYNICRIFCNEILLSLEEGDHASVQMICKEGDLFTTNAISGAEMNFIPLIN